MADRLAWLIRTVLPFAPFTFLPTRRAEHATPIVIIGCDTGMAHLLVERILELKLAGMRVYAGCLTEAAVEEHSKKPGVTAFQIDVTKRDVVEAAFNAIRAQEPHGLFAVVHVAGAMFGGPVEWTSREVYQTEMNLNFFGLLNVIQCSMPLLKANKQSKKRFVAVTSTIAVMPSFPGLSGYQASKAAADALVNTTRLEVLPFGIDVITVCPGITRTPFLQMAKKQMERAWQSAPPDVKASYGEEYAQWWASTVQFGVDWLAQSSEDAVACLVDAATAEWPKTRYFAGTDARILARPAVHLPDFAWDFVIGSGLRLWGQPTPAAVAQARL